MFSKVFWKDALERAIKTAAQFALFTIGATVWTSVGDVVSTGEAAVLAAGFGFLVSILTSLVSGNVGDPDTASLVDLSKE